MELIWQNGQIMIHNQTRRSVATSSSSQTPLPQPPPNPQLFIAEDEMAAWLHYPFEHLYPDPTPPTSSPPPPPPPHFEAPPSRPPAPAPRKSSEPARTELTVVESNEVPTLAASPVRGGRGASPRYDDDDDDEGSIYDMTVTSSSSSEMESETSATETDTGSGYDDDDDDGETVKYGDVEDRKRKEKNDDDDATSSERLFEDVELDSVDDEEHTNGSTSTKRSRASEVHNLSERRRRDRINEKMRALQELIPRSNKSDRASMLDEAIAYLKTLQMRVQMMTMGCGMVPMMYPGIQQPYMPPAGMGMGMSMGMGMDMGMNHPVMPFMSALPGSAAVPTQLTSVLPASAFPMHPVPAHGFSVMHPSNQPDSTNTPYHLHGGGLPQSSNVADPYQQYLVHQQMQMQMQMQRQMQALQNQSVTVPLVSSMPSTSENDHDANKDG